MLAALGRVGIVAPTLCALIGIRRTMQLLSSVLEMHVWCGIAVIYLQH